MKVARQIASLLALIVLGACAHQQARISVRSEPTYQYDIQTRNFVWKNAEGRRLIGPFDRR